MQKKIWVKHMHVGGTVDWDAWQKLAPDATFTPEENITVIGFELHTDICGFSMVDGFTVCYNTLYKGPISEVNHCVGRTEMIEEWRSLLGAQEARVIVNEPLVLMYPAGSGLSIMEGETLVMTTWAVSDPAAHELIVSCVGLLYYLRERAT